MQRYIDPKAPWGTQLRQHRAAQQVATPSPDPWKAWEAKHGIKSEIVQPSLFDHGDGFQLQN